MDDRSKPSLSIWEKTRDKWLEAKSYLQQTSIGKLDVWFEAFCMGQDGFCEFFSCVTCPFYKHHCSFDQKDAPQATFWNLRKAAYIQNKLSCMTLVKKIIRAIYYHKNKFSGG